ncbi:MAG TPA: hypothetical protein VMT78_02855, partial [Terriglobia bacterium]|nr:hypothetical protein [Terriglobia bacterium]
MAEPYASAEQAAEHGHGADGAENAPRLMPRPLAGQESSARIDFGKLNRMEQGFSTLVQLFVYPAISLLILLVVVPLVRPLIVSRNKIFCSALGILIGAIAGTAFWVFGAAFLYGIADMGWPYSLFNVFWFL